MPRDILEALPAKHFGNLILQIVPPAFLTVVGRNAGVLETLSARRLLYLDGSSRGTRCSLYMAVEAMRAN